MGKFCLNTWKCLKDRANTKSNFGGKSSLSLDLQVPQESQKQETRSGKKKRRVHARERE